MARRDKRVRKGRLLSDICTVGELRQARRELELRTWYAERQLADGLAETFSVEGLLSIIAPPGSALGRLVGGAGAGLATVRGILNAIGLFRGRGGCGC